MSAPDRRSISLWVAPEDEAALDDLLALYPRASRHLLAVACVRAGLKALGERPDTVLDHLQDMQRAKRVTYRG